MVTLLDNLAELMPATVRLAGMLQLDRRGVLTLDGLAQAERDISGFVGELRRHPQVSEVRLQSVTASRSEKSQEQGIRFPPAGPARDTAVAASRRGGCMSSIMPGRLLGSLTPRDRRALGIVGGFLFAIAAYTQLIEPLVFRFESALERP